MRRPKQYKTSLTATLYFGRIKWFLMWTWILLLFNCAHRTHHRSDVCACLCLFKSYSQNKKTNTFTLRSWANRLDTLFPPAAGWMIFNSLPIINQVSEGTYNIYVSMYSSAQNLYLRPCSCFFKFTLKTCTSSDCYRYYSTRLCVVFFWLSIHTVVIFFLHSTQEKKRKVVKKKKKPTKSEHSNQQLMLMFITMILALRLAATSSASARRTTVTLIWKGIDHWWETILSGNKGGFKNVSLSSHGCEATQTLGSPVKGNLQKLFLYFMIYSMQMGTAFVSSRFRMFSERNLIFSITVCVSTPSASSALHQALLCLLLIPFFTHRLEHVLSLTNTIPS